MLLLDSQALLWMLDDSPRLRPQARRAITSAQGVHVSAATVWELTVKAASGVACPDPLLADLWAAARSHASVESWVPNYRDLGRSDLTARVLRKRHAAWTRHLID